MRYWMFHAYIQLIEQQTPLKGALMILTRCQRRLIKSQLVLIPALFVALWIELLVNTSSQFYTVTLVVFAIWGIVTSVSLGIGLWFFFTRR